MDEQTRKEIISALCDYQSIDLSFSECKELYEELENLMDEEDFYIEVQHCEFRVIAASVIDEIWTDSLIELIKDCYDLSDVPDFVAIDWDETAENCKIDGLGHHFSSYDGSEHESNKYHYFLVNA